MTYDTGVRHSAIARASVRMEAGHGRNRFLFLRRSLGRSRVSEHGGVARWNTVSACMRRYERRLVRFSVGA
jgi:hypothetical protein